MRKIGIVALATMGLVGVPALSQSTNTECRTIGGVTRCNTESTAPLDYAATLQRGRDLVPPVERQSEPPTTRYVSPPPIQPLRTTSAAIENGNNLLSACEDETFACLAFIRGSYSGFRNGLDLAGAPQLICPPEGVTMRQTRDVVLAFLNDNPAERHGDAAALTIVAMMKAFPCGRE